LQEIAEEGCIAISGKVYSDIKNRAGINTKLVGDRNLKNVDEPVKVYEVLCDEKDENEEKVTPKINWDLKSLITNKNTKLLFFVLGGTLIVIIAAFLIL
jgi:hypothetical protein